MKRTSEKKDDIKDGFSPSFFAEAIIKEKDIRDNYSVCVYNISDDGITFETAYPYSMFRDRIWADNSYHNNKGY